MCEQCLAGCKTLIQEVIPGLSLVQATKEGGHMKPGDFGLVRMNDPDVVWAAEPTPDPTGGMTDDQIDAMEDQSEFFAWLMAADAFSAACRAQIDLTTAYRIGKLAEAAGYNTDEDGFLEHWLFHRMGAMLQQKSQESS